ncbi:MAG: glutamate racemase [Bacteroidales bacterium]|nr:glutamate racemase [Bacteroidales bacterium]MBN2750470.1 glutamate racemase [Bacteroidales bacterium]
MVDRSFKIGVFDSGAGGLTVLKELVKAMPHCSYLYFADSANCPYGNKPQDEIVALSTRITRFLLSKGCDLIVVACNTATAAAIDHLRASFGVPFVGMEPAVKPAAIRTKTNSIGVLATAGTFKGRLYKETSKRYAAEVAVCYQVGEGLVELVEQGKAESDEADALLRKYVDPMLVRGIDELVLGCTHYPFFIPALRRILPSSVEIVDPSPAVAKQAVRLLNGVSIAGCNSRSHEPSVAFYSSGDTAVLQSLVYVLEQKYDVLFDLPTFEAHVDLSAFTHLP